jgi:hypothetical protein
VVSPQGQDERREHDRIRKANRRDAAKAVAATLVQPAPLPPPGAHLVNQLPPAPDGGSAGIPAAIVPAGDAPPVPWKPELLTSLLDQLLTAAEESRVAQFVGKCEEAGITGKLLDEIEKDAHFPKGAKILLKESLPRLAAKWLNRSGISAEYQDEAAVITAILLIVQSDRKNSGKLDELIAQRKAELEKLTNLNPNPTPVVLPDPPLPFGAPKPVTAKK